MAITPFPMTNSHTLTMPADHVPDFASLDPLGIALGATALISAAVVARRRVPRLAPFTPSDDPGLVARASSAGRSAHQQRRTEFFTQSH